MNTHSLRTQRAGIWSILCILLASFDCFGSTAVVVSVPDQKLVLIRDGERLGEYKISTSKFGLSDKPRSYGTPLGRLEVAERIGAGLRPGAVLKGRQATGEVLPVNAAGRDPIVTRILALRGLESSNGHAHDRGIYIHGTPVERTLGKPDSYGCIRMRSADVIELFEQVGVGTTVEIVNESLRRVMPGALASTRSPERMERPEVAPKPPSDLVAQDTRRLASRRTSALAGENKVADTKSGAVGQFHSSLSSVTDLSSLGGVENLQTAHPQERRGGIGLSVSLW